MNCPHGCCGAAVITKNVAITKIFNYGIFSNFTKILNHENLELYGSTASKFSPYLCKVGECHEERWP